MASLLSLLISSLPREVGWSPKDESTLYNYKGFWYIPMHLQGVIRNEELDSSSELNISPSNVILCSFPKSGTTWLKALAFSIMTRTRFNPNSDDHPLLSSFPHNLIPYIEWHPMQPSAYDLPLLSTHIPYSTLPESILPTSSTSCGCKFVYICRNHKDVLVSIWHFMHKVWPNQEIVPFEKAFDLFCQGDLSFGPYWDHVLEYWNASLNYPDRVLFLKYEDLMKDGVSQVKRLAEFLGCPFSEEEEKQGLIARIVELCSFKSLSNMEVNKPGSYHKVGGGDNAPKLSNSSLFRKAEMGDWKNYLTEEMANKIDEIFIQKFSKFGLTL